MSRTTLCVLTAAALAVVSLTVMIVRHHILGDAVKVPSGSGTWRVSLIVQGHGHGDARVLTAAPLDFGRQHVLRESCRSDQLLDKPPDARHPERRLVLWTRRAGVKDGAVRARYECYVASDVRRPSAPMSALANSLYAPPKPADHLDIGSRAGTDNESISALARRLSAGLENPADLAEVLFRHVDREIATEPSFGGPGASAADCLANGSGDAGAKARLLVALLRNRGIPARLVTGLTLTKGPEQTAHHWVEAWVHGHWMAMCPVYHHFGQVPPTFLVFGFGDLPMARGRHIRDLDYAFLVERLAREDAVAAASGSPLGRMFAASSLFALPPAEQQLVEFLLLLPVAALVVCVFRNVSGLNSFGTFAPALVGLAFRDVGSWPGILVFVSILLLGWLLRRLLDRYRLLQVPRSAFLLSLIVLVLIAAIVAANNRDLPATRYVALFPMVILTGMVERFWTLETEDGTRASFKTLLGTLVIAASIALLLSLNAVVNHLFRYPETLGLVMAVQLLLGRYTGYRLTELYRFREFAAQDSVSPQRG